MAGVDLATPTLWLWLVVALVVLPPLSGRRGAFVAVLALLDLTFCAAIVGQRLSGGLALIAFDVVVFVLVPLGLFWLAVRAVADARKGKAATAVLVGGSVLALFVLHKRVDLFPRLFPDLAGLEDLNPVLAVVGFSYVALRALDLIVAVAQGRIAAPSITGIVAYLLPFHMLAAGPVVAAEDFDRQPVVPPPDRAETLRAVERIAGGLFKKFVLAQALAEVALTGFSADGPYFLLEVQLFYLWVYLDFSAYSDIAVGVGRLIGVPTPENFERPLSARNLIVFWERWHITLGAFARRNLFVPLQLALVRRDARRPLLAASVALAVTFVAIGVWHGLTLGFVAWGAMHAAGVVATNAYGAWLAKRLGRKGARALSARPVVRIVATVLTFEFVAVSLMLVEAVWKAG